MHSGSGFVNRLILSIVLWSLLVLSASELGQDTEGAGLGGAGPRVPVLRVLHQTLLAGIAQRGRMILNLYDRFPVEVL